MLVVTEAAGARLTQKLTKRQAGDDDAMRFVRRRQRWKLTLDGPKSEDVVFKHDGRTVLRLDQKVAGRLSNRTLDAQDTSAGARLYFRKSAVGSESDG